MGDRDGKIEPLSINMIEGKIAPRFDAGVNELTPLYATVTAQGMKSGRPLVDVHFEAADGKHFAYTTSGRMMLMLAGAIQAAVVRNGEEPDYVPVLVQCLRGEHPHAKPMGDALREITDRILDRICNVHDGSELWTHARRDPDAFREAVKAALLDVLR
jgi:hypothetical protein